MGHAASRRRTVVALACGALVPGTGHLLVRDRDARPTGIALTALSGVLLLSAALLVVRLVSSPLDAIAFAAAVDGLGLVGLAAALWFVFTAAVIADLVRRLAPSSGGSQRARHRLSLAAVAALVVPALVCCLVSASAFTGRGVVDSIFGADGGLVAHDGRYNVLVVGADRAPGRAAVLPDSISVVSIDAATGRTAVIGIDRTTQNFDFAPGSAMAAQFPQGDRCISGCQLNYSYRYGQQHPELWPEAADPGMGALTDAVEGYTGLTTSGYVYVELDAFVRLIDALGGVTVDVGVEVPRVGVPDEGGDQLTVAGPPIEPGVQHMDGETALWFARSRYASSNSERMARQACLQQALLAQLDPGQALAVFLSLASTTDGIATDLSQSALGTLATLADGARQQPLARVELTHPLVEPVQPDLATVAAAIEEAVHPASAPAPPAVDATAASQASPAPPSRGSDGYAPPPAEVVDVCSVP